ncbi:probable pheromone response factor Prf1 [Sporisorium reilianum f. sp. reilianum]|uniref:Probable pheromone response factor Prf1 n=1 Tax=Sporisorium reilianum f. sp. reilianum TaxID=72559 RepID=A0A2N8UDW7_9BASI|nr:probable pheromone response factor Prf1 [Sporisorium reilianum f. sp. reilianum]
MRHQATTSGMTTRSGSRGHVTVDLFHGWSTDAPPGNSSSTCSTHDDFEPAQDQQASPCINTTPRFQSISFPKRDHSFAVSLYTGGKDEAELDKQEQERIKRLPPSKRPGVSHAKKTPPNHIKRPRNAYIIFRSHTVSQKLIPKEVENDHRNISRIIAHMWKSLKPEDRAHYEQIAREEKERHKQLFPNYRYQPITRRAEVSKRNVKKLENGDEECQEIADIILKAQGKEGVVVSSEPSKPVKRAREATREKASAPCKKRAKVESKKSEPVSSCQSAGQALETVFLHPSPCNSPTSGSGSDNGFEPVPALSPEPFRLPSRTPSVDLGRAGTRPDASPAMADAFGRRASSAPILRPCSPPFFDAMPPAVEQPPSVDSLGVDGNQLSSDVDHAQVEYSNHATMPAPAWKGRKPLPPPIPNTWQLCSYDDQLLPSPRTVDGFASANKAAAGRPRTAWPSTPSSGTFRGFFHPWAFEHANESMLVSPMTASFQDLRRRSSLVRSGLLAGRRPGSFGVDAHHDVDGRMEAEDGSHSLLPTSDLRMSDAQLFDEAARAAGERLGAEAAAVEAGTFAFDPALEGEGYEPVESVPVQAQPSRGEHAVQPSFALPRYKADSPRPSFSGSTLAAAARDWASMKRRRSRMAQSTVAHALSESMPASAFSAGCEAGDDGSHRDADKSRRYKTSLEESVERAVMLALSRDQAHGSDRGEQSSKIVQQILSSLSAELGLQMQQQSAST